MSDSPGRILDAFYKLLIIDHRDDIEELGGVVLLSKVDGKTLKIVLGVTAQEDEKDKEISGN